MHAFKSRPFSTLLTFAIMAAVLVYATVSVHAERSGMSEARTVQVNARAALSDPPFDVGSLTISEDAAAPTDDLQPYTEDAYIAQARSVIGANLVDEARHELKVGQAGIACTSPDRLDAVLQSVANGADVNRMARLIQPSIRRGECMTLNDGARVFVNDINAEHEMLMFNVRIAGTSRDVWMFAASFFDEGSR